MFVKELEREFPLGQEYAIEVLTSAINEEGECYDEWDTHHFRVGECVRNPYFLDEVQLVRCSGNVIYIRVYHSRE